MNFSFIERTSMSEKIQNSWCALNTCAMDDLSQKCEEKGNLGRVKDKKEVV
jgi:hypothetical protein